eukprot:5321316-Heterocapsa_arctica.AAC.1
MGSYIQTVYDRLAIALRRTTSTGGPNLLVLNLLKSIITTTHQATPVLLDHSTLYQAVEEARQRGNPSPPIAKALEDILAIWEHFTLHMVLWESQDQAAEAVWIEAARSRNANNHLV